MRSFARAGSQGGPPPCAQEEHQEQLKAVAELSSVIAGFLMISFLQFNFTVTSTSQPLMLAYAATAALTARSHLGALWPLAHLGCTCGTSTLWWHRHTLLLLYSRMASDAVCSSFCDNVSGGR